MLRNAKSLLFVPSTEKMLGKIGSLEADAYIIDLEDSIAEGDKEPALKRCVDRLNELTDRTNIIVRVNANRKRQELSQLTSFPDIGIMIPKAESAEQLDAVRDLLGNHYVIALVETPRGVTNIANIASCDMVGAVAFGAEDYSASVNMVNDDRFLMYAKSCLVTHAKAYGKKAYDTPSFALFDRERFDAEVENSVSMGFDGKLIISPKHVAAINAAFKKIDIDYMKHIVSEYEKSGSAVFVMDGKVYEKMHINRMKRIITENGGL